MDRTMKNSIKKLLKLIKENPDLPIVPMVDAEICGDDFGTYMGEWGNSYIDEYLLPNRDYNPMMFKSDDDVFYVLENVLPEKEFDLLPESEEQCRKIYDNLPWTKAIIVNINAICCEE